MAERQLEVRNDLADLEGVGELVAGFWADYSLPPSLEGEVTLAVREIVSNVMRHGYRDAAEHRILVRLELAGPQLIAEVEDDAEPFNPLEHPAPDLVAPMERRRPGGLGVFLARSFMDRMEYRREGGRNRLVMRKSVAAGPGRGRP